MTASRKMHVLCLLLASMGEGGLPNVGQGTRDECLLATGHHPGCRRCEWTEVRKDWALPSGIP